MGPTARHEGIKGPAARCCVYSHITEQRRKQGDYEKAQPLHSATWFLHGPDPLRCAHTHAREGLLLPLATEKSVQPHRQLRRTARRMKSGFTEPEEKLG